MPLPTGRVPRLANPSDIPRLISNDRIHHEWPPAGTTVVKAGFPETWVIVYGQPDVGGADDWWLTNLGEIAGFFGQTVDQLLRSASHLVLSSPVLAFAGALSNYPVIYSPGEGVIMRWIRATYRGILGGGVEQFQFKIDYGNPGNDPNLDEGAAGALAEDLATMWAANMLTSIGVAGSYAALLAADVKFTEVGVTSWTQDQAKNADGSGGDAHQEYPNAWYAYPVGQQPAGSGATALPFEVACAVTQGTDKRGPSGRGRLYLPPFATSAMAAGGVFTNNAVATAGGVIKEHFDDVKASYPYVPVVVSMRQKVLNEVRQLTVGKVPDSQRRRRRSQDEAPTVAWTAA